MRYYASQPFLLQFDAIGDDSIGYIVTTQHAGKLPFAVKRVFWTCGTPVEVERGGHANKCQEEVLVAVQGVVYISLETIKNRKYDFVLNAPATGLYVPPLSWMTVRFAKNSLLLTLASTDFDEADYIRDYAAFRALVQQEPTGWSH